MKLYYKLTDQNMKTRVGYFNEHQWELGEESEIDLCHQNSGSNLCTKSWFHVYSHPLLAVFLNPIHANIINPRLFECVCSGLHKKDNDLKEGFTKIRLTSEIQVPEISLTQKIAFGILCTKKVYFDKKWTKWANDWLRNIDRSFSTADAAAYAAHAAAHDAAADNVARVVANAAAYVARMVANVAVNAAYAATYVEADAVYSANFLNISFNLIKIAKQAMKY